MECPERVTEEEFNFMIEEEFKTYKPVGDKWACPNCGSIIQQKTAFVSIHDAGFGDCAGRGEVKRVAIPYCPTCEPEIAEKRELYGCVHV
jgi:hypothetical protein